MPATIEAPHGTSEDWIEMMPALTAEETRQRENETQFDGPESSHPLDIELSNELAREIWSALNTEAAE